MQRYVDCFSRTCLVVHIIFILLAQQNAFLMDDGILGALNNHNHEMSRLQTLVEAQMIQQQWSSRLQALQCLIQVTADPEARAKLCAELADLSANPPSNINRASQTVTPQNTYVTPSPNSRIGATRSGVLATTSSFGTAAYDEDDDDDDIDAVAESPLAK